jgi:signal peptidase II
MKKNHTIFYMVVAVILLLDQVSKYYVQQTLKLYESITVWPIFNIIYIYNPGAAFGFLSGAHASWRNPFFIGVSVLAILLLIGYHHKAQGHGFLGDLGLALIMGGAVGNLIDRIRFGQVVDFLDFHLGGYHWPAFNVADSAISVGVGITILALILMPST